jgi:hypothetical protein
MTPLSVGWRIRCNGEGANGTEAGGAGISLATRLKRVVSLVRNCASIHVQGLIAINFVVP